MQVNFVLIFEEFVGSSHASITFGLPLGYEFRHRQGLLAVCKIKNLT